MTKYFEVVRRDGPARMGKLLLERQISTPALISKDDYVTAGSVYSYSSLDEAVSAGEALLSQKKLIFPAYVPAALRSEPALDLPPLDTDGPKGLLVHPFSIHKPEKADVYALGNAAALTNPRDLVGAVAGLRERIAPDTALYAPALATPANLALLVYLGMDLLDGIRMMADGLLGRYHTRDGVWKAIDLAELPCRCQHCREMSRGGVSAQSLVAHNLEKLEEELLVVREAVRSESLREYVERQVRVAPDQTAALRLVDQEHSYLERRAPVTRRSKLYANCSESLARIEVSRFAERVIGRYTAPKSDVLLLLPCSAKKPYSLSRSHRLFAEAVGARRRYLHELILTSPLALVPRELEEAYPAASYDVPVTGRWDREERAWLQSCLEAYLRKNRYNKIVAHLDGELEQAVKDSGLDATYTGGGTNGPALQRLADAVAEACHGAVRLPDLRLLRYRAHADYYFGQGAGDALLEGKIVVKGREIQDDSKRSLAATTPSGMIW